ncbi:MAG: hypothetical protein ACSLE0_05325 [Chitinophagaceae bacterium]
MKNVFPFIFLLMAVFPIMKQDGDSWKISFANKILLVANEEDQSKNIVSIRVADLNKPGNCFTISYLDLNKPAKKKWKRSILIFDESDNELLKKESSSIKLSAAELGDLFKENKLIKIFTVSVPSDPAEAALVRIRRVHLCTLELK